MKFTAEFESDDRCEYGSKCFRVEAFCTPDEAAEACFDMLAAMFSDQVAMSMTLELITTYRSAVMMEEAKDAIKHLTAIVNKEPFRVAK